MKCGVRFLLCVAIVALTSLVLFWKFIADLNDQYGAVEYLETSIRQLVLEQTSRPHAVGGKPGDKVIVMAKMEAEDTRWVAEELPEWQRGIYTVDPSIPSPDLLTTPTNKGHESMAYLTYVIDHYSSLPSTLVFLHSHRNGFFEAWHVDTPMHDNVAAMQALQLEYVQRNGYVNLRCNWNPGCLPRHRTNTHVTRGVWQEVFQGTSTESLNKTSAEPTSSESDYEKSLVMPMQVGAACCAQFAVSREQVLKRPRDDYVKFRQWILDTEKDDAHSGRVMEFLWHVIFGKEAVYCPDEEVCYCQVYGRC